MWVLELLSSFSGSNSPNAAVVCYATGKVMGYGFHKVE
jgi:hypothetical protein